jgi:hypothetical protein
MRTAFRATGFMVIIPVAKGFWRGVAPIDKSGKSKSRKKVFRVIFFIAISRFFLQKYNNYRFPPNFEGIGIFYWDMVRIFREKGTGQNRTDRTGEDMGTM